VNLNRTPNLFLILLFVSVFQWPIPSLQHQLNAQNVTDANNKKQGYWKITGKMKSDENYENDAIVEEGEFVNGRKNGTWIRYYPDGQKQSEIEYTNGRPKGYYITYFENGEVEEEGQWVRQKNIGTFKRYYENGNIMQEFSFNEAGIRDGVQKYYYENGQIEIEVTMVNGKEDGVMRRYTEDGKIKSELSVSNGIVDSTSMVVHTKISDEPKLRTSAVETKEAIIETPVKPNLGKLDPNGYNKLYTKSLLLKWDGHYKGGKPWDGKKYIYNSNGILQKIEIYKKGFYVGDGVIEQE
jgi:antitoxin component YwqK of YwqJK toxin-antitoxin module